MHNTPRWLRSLLCPLWHVENVVSLFGALSNGFRMLSEFLTNGESAPPPSCFRSRHNAKRLSLKRGKNMEPQKTPIDVNFFLGHILYSKPFPVKCSCYCRCAFKAWWRLPQSSSPQMHPCWTFLRNLKVSPKQLPQGLPIQPLWESPEGLVFFNIYGELSKRAFRELSFWKWRHMLEKILYYRASYLYSWQVVHFLNQPLEVRAPQQILGRISSTARLVIFLLITGLAWEM